MNGGKSITISISRADVNESNRLTSRLHRNWAGNIKQYINRIYEVGKVDLVGKAVFYRYCRMGLNIFGLFNLIARLA